MTAPMIACPRHRSTLSLPLLLCALTASVHAADPQCAPAPALHAPPAPVPAAPDGAIRWSGCHLDIAANGDTLLSGNVVVEVAGRQMHCDRLSYLALTQELQLSGSVRYEDAALRVTGDAGNYGSSGAQFTHAQFELLQHPGRGAAQSVSTSKPDLIELGNVVYTTCPKGAADWELRARRITLDTKAMRGTGHYTRVVFKGVPILYVPWISFPLSSARQTGLLFPTIGSSSRSGAMLALPWYWNIAPNQDLTATPTIYARRGLSLGTEYRLLTYSGRGTLGADYLPGDRVADRDRSWLRLHATTRFAGPWRMDVNAENVSDTNYFQDFADSPQASSIAFLPRELRLGMRGDIWQLRAQALKFQVLDDQVDPATGLLFLPVASRPYAEWPRLTAAARWQGTSGLGSFLDSELIDFHRDTGTTGWRGRLQPGLSYDYTRPGFYLRPHASWDLTAYRLQADPGSGTPIPSLTPSRSLPILTLDSALQLERLAGSAGARLVTLEPRINYVYIPFRDQTALPVFDTGLPDPNFVALYRANRYVGYDRIGDANDLTMGITMRMLQARTGQQYLSAAVGQTLHFSQPRVTLPGETPDTRKRSDLLVNIDLTAYRNWNLHYDVAWNPELSQTEKSLLSLQYRPAGDQVVNLGYRFTRGSVEQAEASAAWPVSRRWDLYGRSVYSVRDHSAIENFAGLQYRQNCWGVRIVVRDAVNRTGSRDTGWYLQLELKGLSSVGSGADAFLQGSIQGYSAR
jgi:LPS-assembly protein